MSDTPKFHNTDGSLTEYALACGYVQAVEVCDRYTVRLTKDGCYHVKVSDKQLDLGLAAWETADTLGEARKLYRTAVGFYKSRKNIPAVRRNTAPDAVAPWNEV